MLFFHWRGSIPGLKVKKYLPNIHIRDVSCILVVSTRYWQRIWEVEYPVPEVLCYQSVFLSNWYRTYHRRILFRILNYPFHCVVPLINFVFDSFVYNSFDYFVVKSVLFLIIILFLICSTPPRIQNETDDCTDQNIIKWRCLSFFLFSTLIYWSQQPNMILLFLMSKLYVSLDSRTHPEWNLWLHESRDHWMEMSQHIYFVI